MSTLSLTLGKLVQQLKLVDQSDLLPARHGRCHVTQYVLTEKLSHSTCFFVTIKYILRTRPSPCVHHAELFSSSRKAHELCNAAAGAEAQKKAT